MKRLPLSSPLLAATLFLAAGLRGEEAKPKPAAAAPGALRAARQAELLKRFDKNGDGRLDEDERIEAKETMMKEQLDRQAARLAAEKEKAEKAEKSENSDKAERSEKFAATTTATATPPAAVTATANATPHASATAIATAASPAKTSALASAPAAANANASPPGPGAGMRAELLRRLDRNGDGKIDEVELADGVNFIAANIDQYPAMKQRFDRNGDGRLDDQERIALDEGLHQLVHGGRRAPAPALAKAAPLDPADEANVTKVMEEFAPRFDAGKKPDLAK